MTYVTTKRYAIGYGRSRVALGRSNHFKTSTDTRLQVSERLSIEQFQTFCTNETKYDGLVETGYGEGGLSTNFPLRALGTTVAQAPLRGSEKTWEGGMRTEEPFPQLSIKLELILCLTGGRMVSAGDRRRPRFPPRTIQHLRRTCHPRKTYHMGCPLRRETRTANEKGLENLQWLEEPRL